MSDCHIIKLDMDYSLYGKVSYILPQYEIKTLDSEFTDIISLKLMLFDEKLPPFEKALSEMSGGILVPEILEKGCFEM